MDDVRSITTGSQFLSPTGRIWTVQAIMPSADRVELTSVEDDGAHGAVMDIAAVLRMVRIDRSEPLPTSSDVEPTDLTLV